MTDLDALIEAVEAGDADACDSACRDMHRTKHEKGSRMSDPIGYWMGEPISEMTREQLLEVAQALGRINRQNDAEHDRHVAMLREISVCDQSGTGSELVRKAGQILGFAIGKVCIIVLGVWLGLLLAGMTQ